MAKRVTASTKTKTTTTRKKTTTKAAEQTVVTEDQIRYRAYELFEKNGYNSGCELENWLQAERELQEQCVGCE